jgi:molecular chaperone DnaJ
MEHHPDKHGGDDAKIKEINEAYETLKDSQKRAAYDQYGHAAAQNGGNPFGGAGGFNAEGFDFSGMGFGDIFDMFFQGQQGGRAQTRPVGRDLQVGVDLTFQEAVFGVDKKIRLELQDICETCEGDGAAKGSKLVDCKTCDGRGQVVRTQNTFLGSFQQATICPTCHGRGKMPEKRCISCHGEGVTRRNKELTVKIPAGIDNGATIRLAGKGEAAIGGAKGDLYVHVRVKHDRQFNRQGYDILSETKISMVQAALGTEVDIKTVDGEVTLKIPAGTQSGKVFRLSERGVPHVNGRGRGSHLVEVTVEVPHKLTAKQKELLEQFEKAGKGKGFFGR